MKNIDSKGFLISVLIVTVLVLCVWWKVSIWQECRAHDSFLYCLHFIGK